MKDDEIEPKTALATGSALTYDQALRKARSMSYDEQRALLVAAGWGNDGHWDNWFSPRNGWNYDTEYAVTNHFQYPPNIGNFGAAPAAPEH